MTDDNRLTYQQVAGFLIIALAMVEMFSIPKQYFILGSIVSTISMICVSVLLVGRYSDLYRASTRSLVSGLVIAVVLYLVFLAGNLGIKIFNPLGVGQSYEVPIYGLFKGVPIYLLLLVFLLDATGFESYFRGILQKNFERRTGSLSIVLVALIDAGIHVSSGNPLFSATTFVADCFWGLNYYLNRDLSSNVLSHFVWDLMIFVILPIS